MAAPNWQNQTIWTGDNLDIMRGMNSASVDLIYLDPPFNSKANYAAPIGSKAAGAAFKDTWTLSDLDGAWIDLIKAKKQHRALYRVILAALTPSDKSYLVYMAARLLEMHRLLKPTGAIYLHCDVTMSHSLKLVMDAIWGKACFRNDITWRRTSAHNDATYYGQVTDNLLYYGASPEASFHVKQYLPHSDKNMEKYRRDDGDGRGRYQDVDLTGPKPSSGESGQPWRGYDPTMLGRCWSAPKTSAYAAWIEANLIPGYQGIAGVHGRLEALQQAGMVVWTGKGTPRLKRYLAASPGTPLSCHWSDIPPVNSQAKEATKYPTQKPLALLKRIIVASTPTDGIVLDPFCGCATACIAAEMENRQWVGIDISSKAADLVQTRMRDEVGLFFRGAHRTDIPQRTDLGKVIRYNAAQNKRTLYGEQGGYCNGCETHFEPRNLTIDHIIPRAKGGTDHLSNLQLLCSACNSQKGDRGMEYLMTKLQMAA